MDLLRRLLVTLCRLEAESEDTKGNQVSDKTVTLVISLAGPCCVANFYAGFYTYNKTSNTITSDPHRIDRRLTNLPPGAQSLRD